MKILDLPLKAKWYKMIESGVKPEEYREIKPYWEKRLINRGYTHVRFRYGYTKRTMLREIGSITIGYGNPDWGAPKDKRVFVIKFKDCDMKPEDNKRNELAMLVNKENQDVFLVVPNVVEGERYFIIRKCDFPSEYHIGDVYLSKEKWLKKLYNEQQEESWGVEDNNPYED